MLLRIPLFYILISTISISCEDYCPVFFDEAVCMYTMTCLNYIGSNMDFNILQRNPHTHNYQDYNESCQRLLNYNGMRQYRMKLIFKDNNHDKKAVPKYNRMYGNNMLQAIYSLDLSNNEYTEIPLLQGMQNLAILNISRNLLTTAILSNMEELQQLTELDLSYNTISNIEVNSYLYLYIKLTKLDLSHNYLVKITHAIFDGFAELQILNLSDNFLDTLNQLSFEGIKKLVNLNLSNNRLINISNSLFRFNELKVLNLRGNRLKDLKGKDFEQLVNLINLDLSSNFIKTVDSNIFHSLILLQDLDISNNQLANLNKDMFYNLNSLKNIKISKNLLKSLPLNLFKYTSVITLTLTENLIEGPLLKGMFDGIHVIMLDLSNQFFTEVKDYAFNSLTELDTLFLNSNNIQYLSNMCFKTLQNLKKLDLSNNQITNLAFNKEDLSKLQILVVKNNRITEIKQEQLIFLQSLEYLDISDNLISRLERSSFQSLQNLINLGIYNNPLNGTLETGTFNGLVLLPSLDISHNMLKIVQNASFEHMTDLKELNISYCKIYELQYNAFINTGYIETLDLSHNDINIFFVNVTELVGLTTLFLNNNRITSIVAASLRGLLRLNMISLSHNTIESVSDEAFNTLVDLKHLDLSNNIKMKFTMKILEKMNNLNTLNVSGVQSAMNFKNMTTSCPILELVILNANIKNISALGLNKMIHLTSLRLMSNNITKLQIGDFMGLTSLLLLDLSFNEISYIQPGVFKDNTLLHTLNISHNHLSSVGYGIFRGLIYLEVLDMSYNRIKDLQTERFYEVKSLTQLIVDYNEIDTINAEEFLGTTLSKLSIGNNPLPCEILVKVKQKGVPFVITALRIDEHSNENVDGVTCNNDHIYQPINVSENIGNSNDMLKLLQNILLNLTNENIDRNDKNTQYLKRMADDFEKSYSVYNKTLLQLVNYTSNINNNTFGMLDKMTKLFDRISVPIVSTTLTTAPVPVTKTNLLTTTNMSTLTNVSEVNQTANIISYINKVKEELQAIIALEKHNIINEFEGKYFQTQSLPATATAHEKLISNNSNTESVFTEICVALILIILIALVLYKFYKSRMFVRNSFSISTRDLPGAIENSAL